MALFLGLRIAACVKQATSPYDPPRAPQPLTTLSRRGKHPKLREQGPTVVAVFFVLAAIACLLVAVTGAAIIGIVATAHKKDKVAETGPLIAAFIPAGVAFALVASVGIEVCIESGRCALWHRREMRETKLTPSPVIEMTALNVEDFEHHNSASSSTGGGAVV